MCGLSSARRLFHFYYPSAAVPGCWLVVVNRARSLQACFHYMTHGSVMPSRRLARLAATVAFRFPPAQTTH